MDEKTNWQSLEKNGPITEYNEPFIEQRADPFVCKAADGTYYFTASYPAYDRILLRSSKTLNGLKDAKERQIWVKHEHGPMSCHIWLLLCWSFKCR
jgi:GH43 family beta-xylosidase